MSAQLGLAYRAPAARVRWGTDRDRRHEPEIARAVTRFARFARGEGDESIVAARIVLLREALLRSPFWLERLRAHGVSASALATIEDLAALPVLEREEVAARSVEMLAVAESEELVSVRSSGSTGAPVEVFRDDYECHHTWACLRFWIAWLGVALPPRPRAVLLCTLPGGLAYSRRAPLFSRGALHRVSVARPDPERQLARARPSVVFTDPAGLAWLASRPAPPRPRLLLSSAQSLAPALRDAVEAATGAPVLDYYATTETGPIAWACVDDPARPFHVLAPDVHVETPGGRVVVTRLRPGPWPLVRYATGDEGRVVEGRCACGYVGPSIVQLRGRGHVRFVRPDDARIDPWRLAAVFKQHALRSYRLVQEAPASFVLELVGSDPGAVAIEVEAALRDLGWEAPRVEGRRVDAIAAPGEKPTPFASRLTGRADPPACSSRARTPARSRT